MGLSPGLDQGRSIPASHVEVPPGQPPMASGMASGMAAPQVRLDGAKILPRDMGHMVKVLELRLLATLDR